VEAIAAAAGYSNSAIASQTFSAVSSTTTALVSSSNPSIMGQPITFTATVALTSGIAIPAGSVQFSVNGTALGSPATVNGGGFATYSTSLLPVGYLNIVATFQPAPPSGSGSIVESSASPTLVQAVFSSPHESNNVWFNNSVKPLGSGFSTPYGVAVNASGNVFVADSGNNAVKEILAAGGYVTVNTLSGASGFNFPTSIAVDSSDNLYLSDAGSNAVYQISAAGGYTTAKSLSSGTFSSPYGLAVDANDNLFVADLGHSAVKELTATSGYAAVSVLGSGFLAPWGVAVDSSENVFVTDVSEHQVKEIVAAGGYSTVDTIGSSFFVNPYGIAVDAKDDLLVTDPSFYAVREVSLVDGWTTVFTPGDNLNLPIGVAVDGAGDVFIADTYNNMVKEMSLVGGNFGSVNVGSASPFIVSMNFFFDASTTLGSTTVVYASGGHNLEFTDAGTGTCWANTPYTANATCTVDISFTPNQTGTRGGAVELLDGSGNVLATGVVQGTGVAN
jgi:sugar lactone lactonase YvrE